MYFVKIRPITNLNVLHDPYAHGFQDVIGFFGSVIFAISGRISSRSIVNLHDGTIGRIFVHIDNTISRSDTIEDRVVKVQGELGDDLVQKVPNLGTPLTHVVVLVTIRNVNGQEGGHDG